jgi:uncharacterized protein (DUF169 family)
MLMDLPTSTVAVTFVSEKYDIVFYTQAIGDEIIKFVRFKPYQKNRWEESHVERLAARTCSGLHTHGVYVEQRWRSWG